MLYYYDSADDVVRAWHGGEGAQNTLKMTMAVPSLISDSPSIMVASVRDDPVSRMSATTATGQVTATISKAIYRGPPRLPEC